MNQRQVWNNIAEEWFKFKTKTGKGIFDFLKTQESKILGTRKSKREKEFSGQEKGKILDLGSGAGRNLIKLKNVEWYFVDFSEKMLQLAKQKAKKLGIKAKFIQADLVDLPFSDNFFDAAIATASLHCIKPKNQEKAVNELFRVLKPEAEAKIAVWNKNSRRFKNAGKEKYVAWRDKGKRYYYLFNEEEIHDLFERHGFKIKKKLEHNVNIDFIAKKSLKV